MTLRTLFWYWLLPSAVVWEMVAGPGIIIRAILRFLGVSE